MTGRHRSRWSYSHHGDFITWVLRFKVDLLIVAVGVTGWSVAVYNYTH